MALTLVKRDMRGYPAPNKHHYCGFCPLKLLPGLPDAAGPSTLHNQQK